MKVINLTPHAITLDREEISFCFLPAGKVARVPVESAESKPLIIRSIVVPVVKNYYGNVSLPAPKEGTVYVVSSQVLATLQPGERDDVLAPDTSTQSAIRDENGQIKAIRRFVRR